METQRPALGLKVSRPPHTIRSSPRAQVLRRNLNQKRIHSSICPCSCSILYLLHRNSITNQTQARGVFVEGWIRGEIVLRRVDRESVEEDAGARSMGVMIEVLRFRCSGFPYAPPTVTMTKNTTFHRILRVHNPDSRKQSRTKTQAFHSRTLPIQTSNPGHSRPMPPNRLTTQQTTHRLEKNSITRCSNTPILQQFISSGTRRHSSVEYHIKMLPDFQRAFSLVQNSNNTAANLIITISYRSFFYTKAGPKHHARGEA